MRHCFSDTDWIVHEGQFVGINLGWDHCSEHEWGIKNLNRDFGIKGTEKPKLFGVKGRKINAKVDLIFGVTDEMSILRYDSCTWREPPKLDSLQAIIKDADGQNELRLYDDDKTLSAAWSDGDFGILTKGKEGRDYLTAIHNAFQRKDIVFWFGGHDNPFTNSGLCIGIASHLPTEVSDLWKASDKDQYDMLKASNATGILQKLEKARAEYKKENGNSFNSPCGFFACSPRWKHENWDDKENPTKHPVLYWLNPMDQQNNNYGLYSVEHLEAWLKGSGPIPKKNG